MPNQISQKKILIGSFCLALVFVTSVITIAYGNLRALRLLIPILYEDAPN